MSFAAASVALLTASGMIKGGTSFELPLSGKHMFPARVLLKSWSKVCSVRSLHCPEMRCIRRQEHQLEKGKTGGFRAENIRDWEKQAAGT